MLKEQVIMEGFTTSVHLHERQNIVVCTFRSEFVLTGTTAGTMLEPFSLTQGQKVQRKLYRSKKDKPKNEED
jgi:hypothetical protein